MNALGVNKVLSYAQPIVMLVLVVWSYYLSRKKSELVLFVIFTLSSVGLLQGAWGLGVALAAPNPAPSWMNMLSSILVIAGRLVFFGTLIFALWAVQGRRQTDNSSNRSDRG